MSKEVVLRKALLTRYNGCAISPLRVEIVQQLSPRQTLLIKCDALSLDIVNKQTARIELDSGTAEIEVLLYSYSMNQPFGRSIKGILTPKVTPCAGEVPTTAITIAKCFCKKPEGLLGPAGPLGSIQQFRRGKG